MILGILMTNEVKIAVLESQVERLLDKQKELTERVRANEKVVAAIGLLGSISVAFIGAGYFAPKAEAHHYQEWSVGEIIEKMREWKSEEERIPVDDMLNNALADLENANGSNGSTESEELLQLPSDPDR